MTTLKTAIGSYGHTAPLFDGRVVPSGFAFDFVHVKPLMAAYRQMVRELAFDVCEMAITTYLLAKAYDKGFTALPIFLGRMFHHGDIQCGADANVHTPTDLHGKRVGVRAYTVTTGVWVRGLLQREYGVDPRAITWVTDDEEHVREFRPPANVVAAPAGESLVSLFASGGIDAAFAGRAGLGRSGPPSENWESAAAAPVPQAPTPLFADADRLDREWFERSGIYPIHGVVVVKDAVLRSDPAIAGELVRVFTAAKECYLGELDARGAQTEDDRKWAALRTVVGGDPLPYGITENRATLDAIVDYAVDQQILSAPLASADLFART